MLARTEGGYMELNIKNMRRAIGVTAEDMAKELDVTVQTYRKYENHPDEMKVKHAKIVAKKLKLPIQLFFCD